MRFEEFHSIQEEKKKHIKTKGTEHNWATHVEWQSATGKVVHHTLTEDGIIEFYDVQFSDKVVHHVPASEIAILESKRHKH